MGWAIVAFPFYPYPQNRTVLIRWGRGGSTVTKRVRSGAKAGSKSKSGPSILTSHSTLFNQPLLLDGEDAAAYRQLVETIRAAIKPLDVIDDILIADIVMLEWEVLRWHRLKSRLITTLGISFLKSFLLERIDYDGRFAETIADFLMEGLPEQETDAAEALAQKCVAGEEEAVKKVTEIFDRMQLDFDKIRDLAKAEEVQGLMQAYLRRERDAVETVHEFFAEEGKDLDSFMASALVHNLDSIERIERLTTMAESRRDKALSEIDRRHAVLGETLRRSLQQIEGDALELIGATADKERDAA
jgi:hypothetical protein